MGVLDQFRFVERLTFFDGQRLFASDLQAVEAFHREVRELHNRSLHQAGVGSGFVVSGELGDRQVTVGPGYAIDSQGHEIILTRSHTEQVPPVEGEDDGSPTLYYLTVSYPADTDLEESETREGICLPRGIVRLREEPVFCWVRVKCDENGQLKIRDPGLARDVRDGRKIVLARVAIEHCQLKHKVSIAQRRNARPATQPYIACGRVTAGGWTKTPAEPLVLERTINTEEAGFQNAPCYVVRLTGARVQGDSWAEALVSIEESHRDSFTIRVFVFGSAPDSNDDDPPDLGQIYNQWGVEWIGIE